MPTADQVRNQIDRLVGHLVEIGLASDQNFAAQRDLRDGKSEVTFKGAKHIVKTLKNKAYAETYLELLTERAFSVCLADGALLQMSYLFEGNELLQHRLAFLPSPTLEHFQSDPEAYMEDSIYAEVLAHSVVPFPWRFDFDARPDVYQELHHPKSHLTLGQYKNCRIPVTSAVTPASFVDFILRNFYNTSFLEVSERIPRFHESFEDCIVARERSVLHMQIPQRAI